MYGFSYAIQDAYEKDAKNPDTLANLVTVGLHTGKNTSRFNKYADLQIILQSVVVPRMCSQHHLARPCLRPAFLDTTKQ